MSQKLCASTALIGIDGVLARRELCRDVDIRTIQCCDRGAPEELERALDVRAQDRNSARYASFSGGGQPVCVCAPDQNCLGSQADGLDDVAAPTDAAVHQHQGLAVD